MTAASKKDVVEWLGATYKTILSAEDTQGSMSIVEAVSPSQSGPPRHIHDREDETFVVLSGACLIWLEGDEQIIGPGETAFVPRGKEHTFKVVSDHPARLLGILSPGGFDDFFYDMAAGQFRIPEDLSAIEERAQHYQLRFTGPAL